MTMLYLIFDLITSSYLLYSTEYLVPLCKSTLLYRTPAERTSLVLDLGGHTDGKPSVTLRDGSFRKALPVWESAASFRKAKLFLVRLEDSVLVPSYRKYGRTGSELKVVCILNLMPANTGEAATKFLKSYLIGQTWCLIF